MISRFCSGPVMPLRASKNSLLLSATCKLVKPVFSKVSKISDYNVHKREAIDLGVNYLNFMENIATSKNYLGRHEMVVANIAVTGNYLIVPVLVTDNIVLGTYLKVMVNWDDALHDLNEIVLTRNIR